MSQPTDYEVAVIGGGPAGATAAADLARTGHRVLLLDKAGRIKPCGGAIPPKLIEEFAIPDSLLVQKVNCARIVAPSERSVDMPINGGFVAMVDREVFDEWLRERAVAAGAERINGKFTGISDTEDGAARIGFRTRDGKAHVVTARYVIGADGARSAVAREALPEENVPWVAAYHEIIRAPEQAMASYEPHRADIYYQGRLSPDFYAWVFPHGDTASIGVGSANKGFSLRQAVDDLREHTGLAGAETIRREGAPIPLRPRKRWDNGRNVVVAGDAAGVVAPASGEGIYYAITGGRLAAEAVEAALASGDARSLALARKRFMRAHGKVFWMLGIMQKFWYSSDKRRERFTAICADPDVQELTWQAYMNKKLVRAKPAAHVRIFFKDLAHLLGIPST